MTMRSPMRPTSPDTFGMKLHRIGLVIRRRRSCQRSHVDSIRALSRSAAAFPGNGSASGLPTNSPGSTGRHPRKTRRSFLPIRRASYAVAAGRRIPMESTHSTRLFRARIRMMCVLLVGSALQSLAKQTMDWPSSMQHLRQGLRRLAVEEEPLPDLEIEKEPQALSVIGGAFPVLVHERPDDGGVEQVAGERPR